MPIERSRSLLSRLGFAVHHTPGISRAWRCELASGDYLLVMNVEGYDLPAPSGPYSACYMTTQEDCIEFIPLLIDPRQLARWVFHAQRLSRRLHSPTTNPTDVPGHRF